MSDRELPAWFDDGGRQVRDVLVQQQRPDEGDEEIPGVKQFGDVGECDQ